MNAKTDWSGIGRTVAAIRPAKGYRFELLRPADISHVALALRKWFPEIAVGSASCYLNEEFFRSEVYFPNTPDKDVLVALIRKDRELAGLLSVERDRDTMSLYARLGVIAPAHRGLRLSHAFPRLAEAIGRTAGMGMVYCMATLKVPHVQRVLEALGWQLIGIAPGYDREMVAPGVVKRVFEAIYAKVLIADTELLRPCARNLTSKTRTFFRLLFSSRLLQRT